MGPQTQDLYVARGGSPTSILSNVHRESHRDPPWGKSSGGRVSGPGRVQHPPAGGIATEEARRQISSREPLKLGPKPDTTRRWRGIEAAR